MDMMIVMAIIEFKRMIRSALDSKLLSKSAKEHSVKFLNVSTIKQNNWWQ